MCNTNHEMGCARYNYNVCRILVAKLYANLCQMFSPTFICFKWKNQNYTGNLFKVLNKKIPEQTQSSPSRRFHF